MKLPESTATTRSAGSSVVERDGERARVDPPVAPASSPVVVRHVAPAALRGDRACATAPARYPSCRRGAQRAARPAAAVAATSPTTPRSTRRWRRSRPGRGRPGPPWSRARSARRGASSTCSARSPSRRPRRRPRISSAASGEAKPPETSSDHGLPANRPLATADVASSAPQAAGELQELRPGGPRAAAGDEHRPAGARRSSASASTSAPDGATAGAGAGGRSPSSRRGRRPALGRLDVQRQVQQDGPPVAGRPW